MRPNRARGLLVLAVLPVAVLTTAAAGVGPLLEPDPARRLGGAAMLLVVLAALSAALYLALPGPARPEHPRRSRVVSLLVLAGAVPVSVPLLAPVGTEQGWETWAWPAAGIAGSAPLLLGWRAGLPVAAALTAASAAVGLGVAAAPWTYAGVTAGSAAVVLAVAFLPWRLWELLEEARAGRTAAGRLATAEERLRFAADVHDLLGHHLTVIALQAELAARTAGTDPDASAGHAEHARSLAASALGELRRTVSGYREVDLPAQLDAVAQVLRASGVRVTLDAGPDPGLPVPVAAVLAAATREAGTNVLRHSRARWCTIAVVHSTTATVLTVANDGVTGPPAGDRHSSGLRGLADRLAGVGGTLDTGAGSGVFTLRAAVPRP